MKKRMKKLMVCVILLVITSTLMACSNKSVMLNEKDAKAAGLSKEDSAEIRSMLQSFTEDAKKKDIKAIQPYIAIEEYIKGYNVELAKGDIGDNAKKPTTDEVVQYMDTRYDLFQFGFTFTDEILNKLEANELDDQEKNQLIDDVKLKSLKILRIDTPMKKNVKSKEYKKMIDNRCKAYGAENIVYLSVLYKLSNKTYYCGFSLYKYNGTWKINDLSCKGNTYINDSVVVLPCSESEYMSFIGNEK